MPSPDDDLNTLKSKISSVKSTRQAKEPKPTAPSSRNMHMATELLVAVGVGGGIGYALDMWIGTSPIAFISFFFLGFAAGVRGMMRSFDEQ